MIARMRRWLAGTPSPAVGYSLAVLLAVAAQAARLPLQPPTLIPFITYIPFIVLSGALGGFGPGLLTTGSCLLEAAYFATEPVGSFTMSNPQLWSGLGTLAFTGLVTSTLFESLKSAWRSYTAITAEEAALARELETRQDMLESIVQNSPVAICVMRGSDFTFVLANPAYEALLPGESLVGRTFASVWPAGAPLVMPLFAVVRDARKVYHAAGFGFPVDSRDGRAAETRFFDFAIVPLVRANDVEILVVAIETTETKKADSALRAAYSQLAAIHANAPVMLLVVDEQFQVEEANELATRFSGCDRSTGLRLSPGQVLGCLNASRDPGGCGQQEACEQCVLRLAVFDTLTRGTRHEDVEAWLPVRVNAQWQQRCLLVSTSAMKLDQATKVLVCAQDITARKQAEVELAHQRDELQRQAELINSSHDAIITADANRVIQGWNRGAEEMYGWSEADAVGNVIHQILRTHSRLSSLQVDEVLSREDQWNGELEHSRRDGRRILVESRQILLRNSVGADVRIMEINRDVTQRRNAEEALYMTVRQLESALAQKTILLKEIHHRVKNSLAVTASLLSMKADGCGPEARLALEESRQRVHSIALVHEHLYDHERLDRINFGEYAGELVRGVNAAYAGEHRQISLDFDVDSIELGIERAVPCALILNELLSNAFKYAFAGGRAGRILVSFHQPERGVCELTVEDDGVGLPSGVLGGNNPSLGLRIVEILARQLDGSVEQIAGPGTRIVLRFPAVLS